MQQTNRPIAVDVLLKSPVFLRTLMDFTSVPQIFCLILTCKDLHAVEKNIFCNYIPYCKYTGNGRYCLPAVCNMRSRDGFKLYRSIVGTPNSRWIEWLDTSRVKELILPKSMTNEEVQRLFGVQSFPGLNSLPTPRPRYARDIKSRHIF